MPNSSVQLEAASSKIQSRLESLPSKSKVVRTAIVTDHQQHSDRDRDREPLGISYAKEAPRPNLTSPIHSEGEIRIHHAFGTLRDPVRTTRSGARYDDHRDTQNRTAPRPRRQ